MGGVPEPDNTVGLGTFLTLNDVEFYVIALFQSFVLNSDDEALSLRMGLACRLAFALSGSSAGALTRYTLRVTPAKVVLDVPRRDEAIAGEPVQKRLGALAAAFGRKGEILIG